MDNVKPKELSISFLMWEKCEKWNTFGFIYSKDSLIGMMTPHLANPNSSQLLCSEIWNLTTLKQLLASDIIPREIADSLM